MAAAKKMFFVTRMMSFKAQLRSIYRLPTDMGINW
jgi:hypothetical protein